MDLTPFKIIFENHIGKWSESEDCRHFRSFFGIHPEVAEVIIRRYGSEYLNRFNLLIVLHYLKVYPTDVIGSHLFKLSRPTYRKYLWNTINYLHSVMDEINMENRFVGHIPSLGLFKNIALVVDGTDIPIERPNSKNIDSSTLKWTRRLYYSGREKDNMKSRYSLKYTIATQISTGEICYLDGPRPGSMNDIRALRESDFLTLLRENNLKEIVLADKGYEGLPSFLTPIKKKMKQELTDEEEAINELIASVRFIVECTLGRMKIFGILYSRYRKGSSNLQKHQKIVNICAQITNISLTREPLSYNQNYYQTLLKR